MARDARQCLHPLLERAMTRKLARAAGLVFGAAVVALLAPRSVLAQTTGTVRGRVTESGAQAGVSDAQVSIVGTQLGAITNAIGDYTIGNVPAGTRQVMVRRIGYLPRTM